MAHPSFAGFDDRSLLRFFLARRDSDEPEERRRARLAWSVLCARDIERMRAYVVLYRRRRGRGGHEPQFDERVLQVVVERALAAAAEFRGSTLSDFRAMVRGVAQRACAEALGEV